MTGLRQLVAKLSGLNQRINLVSDALGGMTGQDFEALPAGRWAPGGSARRQPRSLGGKLLAVAGLLAAIGTLAMTAVETASNLWRGRMRMHRRLFQAWVRADLTACFSRMHAWAGEGDADTPSPSSLPQHEATEAERQFLQLACGDLRHAQICSTSPPTSSPRSCRRRPTSRSSTRASTGRCTCS
jgi:hypothetical protein